VWEPLLSPARAVMPGPRVFGSRDGELDSPGEKRAFAARCQVDVPTFAVPCLTIRYMGTPKEYDPEPLIEAVTSLDWNVEHARQAMKAIQRTVLKNTGDDLSDTDAVKVLGRLVERKLIRTRIGPLANVVEPRWTTRKAKYFRVPANER
jgi:hypothetical protein